MGVIPDPSTQAQQDRQTLERLGLQGPDQLMGPLQRYLDFLLEANQRVNLTAVRDRQQAWRRLILDSLTLVAPLSDCPEGARLVDVGSGGGLPGIPIAIARPGLRVTLLETTGKKARFLQDCVARLGLPSVRVVQDRAEVVGQDPSHRQVYDVAVCRGVGPMNRALEYTLPLVRVGGCLLTVKGTQVQCELEEATDALMILGGGELHVFDAYPDGFDESTLIVHVAKDRPTPSAYPRQPGVPQRCPL